MPSPEPIRVLYFAAVPRSGTTITANALGELPGLFAGGELCSLWAEAARGRRCGCGVAVAECPLWSRVLPAALGEGWREALLPLQAAVDDAIQARRLPGLLFGRRQPAAVLGKALPALYRAIVEHTGATLVVDTSKNPAYGALLEGLPGFDVRFVQLVRDPRATTNSMLNYVRHRRRVKPKSAARGAAYCAVLWDTWHLFTELRWGRRRGRYLRVRYEDFAARPAEALARIGALAGQEAAARALVADGAVRLAPNHNIFGNDNRFTTGDVAIRPDQRWRASLHPGLRALVLLLTWPLFLRHYLRPVSRPKPNL